MDNDDDNSNDLSLGSDDDVFVNPGSINPIINSAINRIKKTKTNNKTKIIKNTPEKPTTASDNTKSDSLNVSTNDPNLSRLTRSKYKKPPPIFTAINTKFDDLAKILNKIDLSKWNSTVLNNDSFKINAVDDDTHAKIINDLKNAKIYFNTYENKNTRPIRVLVKGLHHLTPSDSIINSLKNLGFKPISATSNLKRIVEYPESTTSDKSKTVDKETSEQPNFSTKPSVNSDVRAENSGGGEDNAGKTGEGTDTTVTSPPVIKYVPLNTFTISFDHSDKIEKIYEIKVIANSRVTVEPTPANSPLSPIQCTRCQSFNHSANFCFYPPRCVKCSGEHLSSQCEKPKYLNDPICANCGKNHPASYRGCIVAKTVAEQRRELFKKIEEKRAARTGQQVPPAATTLRKGVSFRDAFNSKREFPHLRNQKIDSTPQNSQNVNTPSNDPSNVPTNPLQNDKSNEILAMMSEILSSIHDLSQRVITLENKTLTNPSSSVANKRR